MTTEPVELRDVRGPSALGGGWKRSLDLLYLMASTDFKRTYFGTALGYIWTVARPLCLFAVLYTVFTQAFHVNAHVPHYPVMLLFNITLFGFFQEATVTGVTSIVSHEAVVRKTQFPRLVIPLAVVATALFNLGPSLIVVFVFMLATGVHPMWTWLLLPVIVLMLLGITIATTMILSSLYPRFRDLGIIWGVLQLALFYATPILYAPENAGSTLRHVIVFNPLTPIFMYARKWIIDPNAPTPSQLAGSHAAVLIPVVIYLAICALAVWVFRREAPRIAESL
jgi:ABC-2 type transport system permease protein